MTLKVLESSFQKDFEMACFFIYVRYLLYDTPVYKGQDKNGFCNDYRNSFTEIVCLCIVSKKTIKLWERRLVNAYRSSTETITVRKKM